MAILRVRDIDGNLYDIPVIKGDPGYTPVKGEDYWTEEELEAVTAELLANARSSDWIPTAEEVGARPNTWIPTAYEVGATPASHANDKNNPHGVTAAQVGARPNTWLPTASEVGAAPSSHSHAASNITSGTLGVARGGTGKATHSANAVLTGNGANAVNNVATANGALYATSANGVAKFGTLPVAQGGTGATNVSTVLANLGGVSMKLLWENASSSSTFAAQTLSLSTLGGTAYDAYVVLFKGGISVFCVKGKSAAAYGWVDFMNYYAYAKMSYRYTEPNADGSLTFGDGNVKYPDEQQYNTDNAVLVPIQIYGIKGVK